MNNMKIKYWIALVTLLTVAGLTTLSVPTVRAGHKNESTDNTPTFCDELRVETGNKVVFHVYARGVQVYKWNGTSWVFVAPQAALFASPNYSGQVGIHYVGPTWESNSGSTVVARRVNSCAPDPTAIPWLLLQRSSASGPGIFGSVTFIQRVNTTGGLAPSNPGTTIDEVSEVPYTAEYYFYQREDG